jgi:hypothetical protein
VPHGGGGRPPLCRGALPVRGTHHWRRGVLGAVAPVLGLLCRALAAVAAMGAAVEALDAAFQCCHLWLVGSPPDLHAAVWDVVALAAVAVMERGCQCMYNVWDTCTALPRGRLVSIAAEVVADFWARLASFTSLGIAPRDWHSVPPGHLFLCCVSDRVVMNGFPDVALPPGSPVS